MKTPKSFSEVMELFGHRTELAKVLTDPGKDILPIAGLVRIWRFRGWIPPRYYRKIAEASKDIGHPEVTVKLLETLNMKRRLELGTQGKQVAAQKARRQRERDRQQA